MKNRKKPLRPSLGQDIIQAVKDNNYKAVDASLKHYGDPLKIATLEGDTLTLVDYAVIYSDLKMLTCLYENGCYFSISNQYKIVQENTDYFFWGCKNFPQNKAAWKRKFPQLYTESLERYAELNKKYRQLSFQYDTIIEEHEPSPSQRGPTTR